MSLHEILSRTVVILSLGFLALFPVQAQFVQDGEKLVGTGGVGRAWEGWSVALSSDGNTAIVGGIRDNANAGAVWVFTRTSGVWSQQGTKLVGTGAVGNANQGRSVALSSDGKTAIVGGYWDSSNAGAAWVFTSNRGSLTITLYDAENWGQPGVDARVVLYNSSGSQVAQGQANSSSVVTFTNVPAVAGYYYRVYDNRATPWGEQFWGEKTGITINANQTRYGTHTHNTPYMPSVSVYIDGTNELLPDGGKKPVAPGTRVRIELQIKNPAYDGAQTVSAYGGLYLDRDKAAPYDVSLTTSPQSYSTGTTKTVVFYCDAPGTAGDYYLSVGAFASSDRYATTLTDGSGWHDPAFTVASGPGSLTVTVKNAEDWGYAGADGTVKLYFGVSLISSQSTDSSSIATFAGVPAGTDYYYAVRYVPSSPTDVFGTQYWGKKTGIAITNGQTTNETFQRNAPYALAINVYNQLTNADVWGQTVQPGTQLRIELTVKNPTYAGALTATVQGRIVLDTNKASPYEADMSSPFTSLPVGTTAVIPFLFTPTAPGKYYHVGAVMTDVDGSSTMTDGGVWHALPMFTVSTGTGVTEREVPKEFILLPNYPNPFNPGTTIQFGLPKRTFVSLTIFNTMGEQVAKLVDDDQEAGYYSVRFNASSLSSGVYFYRMQAGSFVQTRKLLLIR
jgi:hypothetical protein